MTDAQALIVQTARHWIGTAYVHQSATRGAGCDCLGLVRGIWREVIGPEPQEIPAYSMDWSEPQGDELLWQAALQHLTAKPLTETAPGDVLLFRMRSGAVAKHLGILVSEGLTPSFMHAFSGHGVIESPLSAPWRRRIVARFEFPAEAI